MRLNVIGDRWVDLYEPGKVFPILTDSAEESDKHFVDDCMQMLETRFKTVHTYDRPWIAFRVFSRHQRVLTSPIAKTDDSLRHQDSTL
jgi:hypothetical protein